MRVFFVLIFGVFLAASIQAQAQPLFPHANSIETTVANADLVFIGTIARFQSLEHGDAPKGRPVEMVIEEILKMDLQEEPYKRLGIFIPGADSVLGDWMKRSCRLLVAYNETAPKASTVIELAQDKVEVMTADCRLLRDPEAVVQAARETVRRMPRAVKRIHTFKLKVAREAITGTRWERYYDTGGHLVLSVPADEELERKALEYIRSESYEERRKGVQALWFFKSQENVLRIKAMLADPGTSVFYDGRPDEDTDIETKYYGVRSAAYSVLTCWGLTCEKPVILEKSPK